MANAFEPTPSSSSLPLWDGRFYFLSHLESIFLSFPFFVFAGVRRRFVFNVRDFETRKCFPNSAGVFGLGASGAWGLRVARQIAGRPLDDGPRPSLHYGVGFAV
jgi:hypothetical protein